MRGYETAHTEKDRPGRVPTERPARCQARQQSWSPKSVFHRHRRPEEPHATGVASMDTPPRPLALPWHGARVRRLSISRGSRLGLPLRF